jgi:flagellar motor switch/type III secretory pathway protein FliN
MTTVPDSSRGGKGSQVRPIRWGNGHLARAASAVPASPPMVPVLPWFDTAGFVGQFAPELARVVGTRISVRPTPAPDAQQPVSLIRILDARSSTVEVSLDLDRASIGYLLERMFGGGSRDGAPIRDALSHLSPTAASWRGLSACLAQAFRAGLAAALDQAPPAPVGVTRIAEAAVDGPHARLWFALAVDGASGWLVLACRDLEGEAASPKPASPFQAVTDAPSAWSDRAAQMVNRIELEVAIRLSEQRVPLSTILALAPGSILPIDRPRDLVLLVDGKPWRRFDTAALRHCDEEVAP